MNRERFSIIIDSNEYSGGCAWTFPDYICHVKSLVKLGCDYSIRGHTGIIGVERKSFPDYVRCLGIGWKGFTKQLVKLSSKNRIYCVIVEGNLNDKIPIYSKMTQSAVIRQTAKVVSYGIPVLFASSVDRASSICTDFFIEALKRIREGEI